MPEEAGGAKAAKNHDLFVDWLVLSVPTWVNGEVWPPFILGSFAIFL